MKQFTLTGPKGKERMIDYPVGVNLINEEYTFEFDWKGNCLNGEFEVYSYKHKNIMEIYDV